MILRTSIAAAVTGALVLSIGCGDDSSGPSGSGGSGGAASTGASTSSSTSGTTAPSSGATTGDGGDSSGSGGDPGGTGGDPGGTGGSGTGGDPGGTGGGGGLAERFPWEGAIDTDAPPSSSRLVERQLGTTTAGQGFYEYVPPGYPGDVEWALLVFIHGLGENGNGTSQLVDVLATGIPDLIERDAWPNDRPFVVLMPQNSQGDCTRASDIEAMIAYGLDSYAIDPRYVYLTGLSCGAIGSWSYLEQHLDEQIAAFVPIAGNGAPAWNSKGCDLGRVAVWGFHGDDDEVVLPSGTHIPLDGLAGCPAPPARPSQKTIYPGVEHDSWTRTYDLSAGHDIYTWMLGFTREP
jgi:dienelactone hydrolase